METESEAFINRKKLNSSADIGSRVSTLAITAVLLVTMNIVCSEVDAQIIQTLVDQISQSQYTSYHIDIENSGLGLYDPAYDQGYRNRDGYAGGGTLGNQEAALYLYDQFDSMGLSVYVQGTYNNIVGELTGTTTPENIFIVGAHYDTYLTGERPGGDDNASGTAGVLELASTLSQYTFGSTIRFIAFNAEEDGMLGSTDYVNNVVLANNENIVGMINLDMILRPGWDDDPCEPADLDITTDNSAYGQAWANKFIAAAGEYAPSLLIDSGGINTANFTASDQGSFITAGFAALMASENIATEIWGGSNAYYHSAEDASDALANDPGSLSGVTYDYAFATDVLRASAATLAIEAGIIPEPATLILLGLGGLVLRRKRC